MFDANRDEGLNSFDLKGLLNLEGKIHNFSRIYRIRKSQLNW